MAVVVSLSAQTLWAAEATITLVRVVKSEQKLQLVSGDKVVRDFRVAFGDNPKGHKLREGDERTPEGIYTRLQKIRQRFL